MVGDIVQRATSVSGRTGAVVDTRSFCDVRSSTMGLSSENVPATELKYHATQFVSLIVCRLARDFWVDMRVVKGSWTGVISDVIERLRVSVDNVEFWLEERAFGEITHRLDAINPSDDVFMPGERIELSTSVRIYLFSSVI